MRYHTIHKVVSLLGLTIVSCAPGMGDEDVAQGVYELPVGSNAQFVSHTIPATLAPGERVLVSVTMGNNGVASPANDWIAAQRYALYRVSTVWGWSYTEIGSNVPVGSNYPFQFVITAPTTPGAYDFTAQMRIIGESKGFGQLASVPAINVSASATPQLGCEFVPGSSTVPTTMTPGERRSVTAVVRNSGLAAWPTSYLFKSQDSPASFWGQTQSSLSGTVAPGANATFVFTIQAPTTAGTYQLKRQMFDGAGVGFFAKSSCLDASISVGAGTANYSAAVASQTVPTRLEPGQNAQFVITMQNDGSTPWSGSAFSLASTNSPTSIWGVTGQNLGAAETVASGATRQFTLNVTAPTTAGTYQSHWRMRNSTLGLFGAEATASVLVTLCANGTVDAGEQCDDGNTTNGDGCTDQCVLETRSVDLASDAAGRTLIGTQNSKQLANVAIGDVTNDGTADVVVAENANISTPAPLRNQAGVVYGYSGGSAFLTGTSTSVSAGPAFTILGATSSDGLGAHGGGGLVIADVTGDGVKDIIVSAPGGDGAADGRLSAGEVYVFAGGATLTGTLDLRATPTAALATIIGATAGDELAVLAAGDVTGDGVADLLLGAPNDDTNGVDAGSAYVVAGGAALTGTIDLAAPAGPAIYTIRGPAAGAFLGASGAVGDFGGTATGDVLLGAAAFDGGGRSNAGGAWGLIGPISANADLSLGVGAAGGPSVAFLGQTANDKLGNSVAIGSVTGTGNAIIGAIQGRKGGVQTGAVYVFAGVTAGTTYDLGGGATPTVAIYGRDGADAFGTGLAVADYNNDGQLDIAVGAYAGDGPANNRDGAGELMVIRGRATWPATVDTAAITEAPHLGIYGAVSRDLMAARSNNIAFADLNGDGRADVCVGSMKGGTGGTLTAPGRIDCVASQ